MLTVDKVSVALGRPARPILQSLSFSVQAGEFVVILGGNGAGKSTLFNVIAGLLSPNTGTVSVAGQDMRRGALRDRSALVSTVMQDPRVGTMANLTVFENMAFAEQRGKWRSLWPFGNNAQRERFISRLRMLDMGLENFLDQPVGSLSGGQRQAISVVMSMLVDAHVLLLDEIAAALDPGSSQTIMAKTANLVQQQRQTCLMITHDLDHALQFGDRLIFLRNGVFVADFDATAKAALSRADLAAYF